MATIPATEFKARCLELMDRVAEGRETYVITKHGRPVARLVPPERKKAKSIFGWMADRTILVPDDDTPPWSDEQWKEFERQRLEQSRAWDREWRLHGTISGKRGVGAPPRRRKRMAGPKAPARRAKR
jgi:prevent-host-death family protein